METENPRLNGESKEWFDSALEGLSDSTREQYLSKFFEFLKWAEIDSETLLSRHETNLKSENKRDKKRIPKLVYEFQKYRVEVMGDKVASSKTIVKVVKKFFKSNEADFSMGDFKVRVTDESQTIKEIPNITKPQLTQILKVCGSLRMNAIIHVARDTGLRISDICHIKMDHVQPILDGEEWLTFEILPQKNMNKEQPLKANPVMGPDTADAIRLWVRRRAEMGIESPYLFTSVKNVKAHTDARGRENKAAVRGERLNPSNAGMIFRLLREKAGLRESKVSIHSLRKYHKTNLEYPGGCPVSWINRMQGRRGEGTGGLYSKPDPHQLIEVYQKAYTALQLQTPETQQVETLRRRIETRDNDIDQLKEAYSELAKITKLQMQMLNMEPQGRYEPGKAEELRKKLQAYIDQL